MQRVGTSLFYLILFVTLVFLINRQQEIKETESSAAFLKEMNERSDRLEEELQPLIARNKKLNEEHGINAAETSD